MIRLLLLPVLLCTLLQAQAFYLMPDEGERAEKAIVQTLATARDEIILTLYTFTNNSLAKAIRQAASRGVRVLLIVDEKSLKGSLKDSKVPELAKLKNVTVKLASGKTSGRGTYAGLMHLKLAVIDRKTVIHGSANWSHSAFNLNHELLFIQEDETLAQQLLARLKPLFETARPY